MPSLASLREHLPRLLGPEVCAALADPEVTEVYSVEGDACLWVATGGVVVDGNDPGDRFLEVDLADLPPGGVATVNFTVRISTPFPPGLDHIACQGQVVGSNVPLLLTDDPDTPEPSDPTVTPVLDDGTATSLVEVPTLSTWGLVALSVTLAGFALLYLRSRTGGGE